MNEHYTNTITAVHRHAIHAQLTLPNDAICLYSECFCPGPRVSAIFVFVLPQCLCLYHLTNESKKNWLAKYFLCVFSLLHNNRKQIKSNHRQAKEEAKDFATKECEEFQFFSTSSRKWWTRKLMFRRKKKKKNEIFL